MVVRVTVSNNNSILIEATKETLDILDKAFTAPDFSECYVYGKFHKEYMKMIHMLIRSKETPNMAMLPIGFLSDLETILKKHKAIYKIIDKRQPKKFSFTDEEIKNSLGYVELRDYQINAVKNMLNSVNGAIKATTASGKTECIISYCKLTGLKTLILFKRIDLARQTLKRMKAAGLDAGIVQGAKVDDKHQVVMATVQSGHKLSDNYDCIVVDECFPADTYIKTEFGDKKIETICNTKSTENVWSFNNDLNEWQLKPITNWYIKETSDLIEIEFNGKSRIKCTPNHPIYLDNYIKIQAKDAKIDDSLIVKPKLVTSNSHIPKLSKEQYQSVLGMILGDSNLSKTKNSSRIRFSQGENQLEYLKYKIDILKNQFVNINPSFGWSGYQPKNKIFYISSGCSEDYNNLYNQIYINGVKTIKNIIEKIDENSLAFWIMDDGCLQHHNGKNDSYHYELATHSFSKEENELILFTLKQKFDINGRIKFDNRCDKYWICFNTDSTDRIASLICKFIPEPMQYKLPEKYHNKFTYSPKFENYSILKIKSIKNIHYDNPKKVYNITVENNHNYLVGAGYLVGNCHNASSEQYQMLLCNKYTLYRFGFSATPFVKKDKLKTLRTKAWLGSVLFEICAPELMEGGYIAKPNIHMVPIKKPDNIQDQKWPFCETLGIIENVQRNNIIAELANNLSGQILILVQKIDHGNKLSAMINDSYFLSGVSDIKEREETVKRFEAGEPIKLIASTIFDEGVDIKCVRHVIVAGGGQSFIKTVQRLGRGLRIVEGKTTVDFYDFYDSTNPTLEKHSNERIKTYRGEGFNDITVFKLEEWRESLKIKV